MVTKQLRREDRVFLKALGKRIETLILKKEGYRSLDAFALERHDLISKPTLYQICSGKRDMKMSTIRGLASALDLTVSKMLEDLDR